VDASPGEAQINRIVLASFIEEPPLSSSSGHTSPAMPVRPV
jgi:hypothetical protein